MKNIDLSLTLPSGVELMVGAGGMLLLSAIIVMFIVIKKRFTAHIMPFFLGIAVYLVVVFTATNVLTTLLSLIPSVSEAFTYNPVAYAIISSILTAIACVAARFILSSMLVGKLEQKGDIYMAGIGIGAGEAILYGMTAVSYYIWCLAISNDGLANVIADIPPDQLESTVESISLLFTAPTYLWLLLGVNAIFDLLVQFALTNVAYGMVKKQLPNFWYGVSAVVSFCSVLIFQVYDGNSVVSIAVAFAIKAIITAAVVYYTFNILSKEIKYSED